MKRNINLLFGRLRCVARAVANFDGEAPSNLTDQANTKQVTQLAPGFAPWDVFNMQSCGPQDCPE